MCSAVEMPHNKFFKILKTKNDLNQLLEPQEMKKDFNYFAMVVLINFARDIKEMNQE
jgi:hypothetical protein